MNALGAGLSAIAILAVFGFAVYAAFKIWSLKVIPFLVVFLLTYAFAESSIGHAVWTYILSIPHRVGIPPIHLLQRGPPRMRNRTTWAVAAGLLVAAVLGGLSASNGEPLTGMLSGAAVVFVVVAVVAWGALTLAGLPRPRPVLAPVPDPQPEPEVMPGRGGEDPQAVR